MNSQELQRLYERASHAAGSLERQLPWLEAVDTDIDAAGSCQNEFRLALSLPGATQSAVLGELIEVLRRYLAEAERLAESQRAPRIMAGNASALPSRDRAIG